MAIDTEIKDGVGELIINAPPVNALDNAGWKEFAAKMTALGQTHSQNRISRLHEGQIYSSIGLGTGVGLDIYIVSAEQFLGPVDSQLLCNINILAAPVISLAGITLGILVGQL